MDAPDTSLIFEDPGEPREALLRFGVVVLSSDEVGADAFASIMPEDEVSVVSTRVTYKGAGEIASFSEAVNTLPPEGRLDLLAFSCTSGSIAMGAQVVLSQLEKARPGLKYTSPAVAGLEALRRINAKKIALLTPYGLLTHETFLPFFRKEGFELTAHGTFNKSRDAEISAISREAIFDAAKTLIKNTKPDALFISCTAIRIVPHIEDLEREIEIPVISSAQAMAWHSLRLTGFRRPIAGFGSLLTAE
ncbi:maleate cis-trans isomerase family protein [Bradyrhizobium ottawaense]|uniref:maleate cis-trans isomerase family protein n=1 Tax=Bradyrhizobium ottawaense TaxID=931866 RepID=UPI003FA0F1D0